MTYSIFYHPDVQKKDIPKLNRNIQKRIQTAIEKRLMVDPYSFGLPLKRSLKGFCKLRVGDYRVIFKVYEKTIYIYAIGHRKEVYENKIREWPN